MSTREQDILNSIQSRWGQTFEDVEQTEIPSFAVSDQAARASGPAPVVLPDQEFEQNIEFNWEPRKAPLTETQKRDIQFPVTPMQPGKLGAPLVYSATYNQNIEKKPENDNPMDVLIAGKMMTPEQSLKPMTAMTEELNDHFIEEQKRAAELFTKGGGYQTWFTDTAKNRIDALGPKGKFELLQKKFYPKKYAIGNGMVRGSIGSMVGVKAYDQYREDLFKFDVRAFAAANNIGQKQGLSPDQVANEAWRRYKGYENYVKETDKSYKALENVGFGLGYLASEALQWAAFSGLTSAIAKGVKGTAFAIKAADALKDTGKIGKLFKSLKIADSTKFMLKAAAGKARGVVKLSAFQSTRQFAKDSINLAMSTIDDENKKFIDIAKKYPKDFFYYTISNLPGFILNSRATRFFAGTLTNAGLEITRNWSQIKEDAKNGKTSTLMTALGTAAFMGTMDAIMGGQSGLKMTKKKVQSMISKVTKEIVKKGNTGMSKQAIQARLGQMYGAMVGVRGSLGNIRENMIDRKFFKKGVIRELARSRMEYLRRAFPKQSNKDLASRAVKDARQITNMLEDAFTFDPKKIAKFSAAEMATFLKSKHISLKGTKATAKTLQKVTNNYIENVNPAREKILIKKMIDLLGEKKAVRLLKILKREKVRRNPLAKQVDKLYTDHLKTVGEARIPKDQAIGVIKTGDILTETQLRRLSGYNQDKNNLFRVRVVDNTTLAITPKVRNLSSVPQERIETEVNKLKEFLKEGAEGRFDPKIGLSADRRASPVMADAKRFMDKYVDDTFNVNERQYNVNSILKDINFTDATVSADESVMINNIYKAFTRSGESNFFTFVKKHPQFKRVMDDVATSIKRRNNLSVDKLLDKQSNIAQLAKLGRTEETADLVGNLKNLTKHMGNVGADDFSNTMVKEVSSLENFKTGLFKKLALGMTELKPKYRGDKDFLEKARRIGIYFPSVLGTKGLGLKEIYKNFSSRALQQYLRVEQGGKQYEDIFRMAIGQLDKGFTPKELTHYSLMKHYLSLWGGFRTKVGNRTVPKWFAKLLEFSQERNDFGEAVANGKLKQMLNEYSDKDLVDLTRKVFKRTEIENKLSRVFTDFTKSKTVKEITKKLGVDLEIPYFQDTDILGQKEGMSSMLRTALDQIAPNMKRRARATLAEDFDRMLFKRTTVGMKVVNKFMEEQNLKLPANIAENMDKNFAMIRRMRKIQRGYVPINVYEPNRETFNVNPNLNLRMSEQLKRNSLAQSYYKSGREDVLLRDPSLIYATRMADYFNKFEMVKYIHLLEKTKMFGHRAVLRVRPPAAVRGMYENLADNIKAKNLTGFQGVTFDDDFWVIKPVARVLENLTTNSSKVNVLTVASRFNSLLKTARLWKSFILWWNDAKQIFVGDGIKPFAPKYIKKAISSMSGTGGKKGLEDSLEAGFLGVDSRTIDWLDLYGREAKRAAQDTYQLSQLKEPFKSFKKPMDFLFKNWHKFYKTTQGLAWKGDQILRRAYFIYLKDNGMTPSQAAEKVKLFMVSYDRWDTQSRRIANLIFKYPTYRAQMLRLFKEIGKNPAKYKGSIARMLALKFAEIEIAQQLGYSWGGNYMEKRLEDLKKEKKSPKGLLKMAAKIYPEYRGTKLSDEGRLIGITYSGLENEIPKYLTRGWLASITMNLSEVLNFGQQIIQNRGDDWKPIITDHSSPHKMLFQAAKWIALDKAFPPLGEVADIIGQRDLSPMERLMAFSGFSFFVYYTRSKIEIQDDLKQARREKLIFQNRGQDLKAREAASRIRKLEKEKLRYTDLIRKYKVFEKISYDKYLDDAQKRFIDMAKKGVTWQGYLGWDIEEPPQQ